MAVNKLIGERYFVEGNRLACNETFQNMVLNVHPPSDLPNYVFLLYGAYVILIFLLGIIQNSVTLFVFLKTRRLWKVHNFFIVGLAFSDVGMCLCSHWMIISSAFNQGWLFGRTGCVYYGFITTTLGITQISLLAVIAFDRYAIIVKPRGFVMTPRIAVKIMIGCYCYGIFWAVLPALGWNSYQLEGLGIRCAINWQSQGHVDLSFSMTILVLGWLLPLSGILVSYRCMFKLIKTEKKKTFHRRTKHRQRLERKMAITVLLMIGAFFISWSPYSVVTLIVAFGRVQVPVYVSIFPALIAKTSIIWNPIIYVARHNAFRQACFDNVPCLAWCWASTPFFKNSDDNLMVSKSLKDRQRRPGVTRAPRLRRLGALLAYKTKTEVSVDASVDADVPVCRNGNMRQGTKSSDDLSLASNTSDERERRRGVISAPVVHKQWEFNAVKTKKQRAMGKYIGSCLPGCRYSALYRHVTKSSIELTSKSSEDWGEPNGVSKAHTLRRQNALSSFQTQSFDEGINGYTSTYFENTIQSTEL